MEMANINKNTWLIILLVALNLTSLGALWFTNRTPEQPFFHERRGKMRMDKFLKKELQLSEEQLDAFKELRQDHFEHRKSSFDQLREKKRALIHHATGPDYDSIYVNKLVDEIVEIERKNELHFIEHMKDLKAVCTPDQLEKLSKVFHKGMRTLGPPKEKRKH